MKTPKMTHRWAAAPLLALMLFGSACATPQAPMELKRARSAYQAAKSSVASELAPADVASAYQALTKAEQAFESDPDSQETKHLAYIAQRKSQLASTRGHMQAARRRAKELEERYDELERKVSQMTAKELAATKAALAKKQREAEQLSEKSQELASEKEKLSTEKAQLEEGLEKTKEQLEKERAARQGLEKKLGAAMKSMAELAKVKEEKRGVVITLSGGVLFATGKHELLPIAQEKLTEVAKALKDQGFKKITVEGHTDSRGSEANNRELSLKRANSVREYLVAQGIEPNKIEAKGLGESRPVATNATPEGRANNRRVELVVTPE